MKKKQTNIEITDISNWPKMSDFNSTEAELRTKLKYCFEAPDGRRYFYEGTIPLLFKMIGYLGAKSE